jgi:hypothetical protein
MRRISHLRPSPAMIVALLSLFVALGGVGYAAATIGTKQIRNNSVRGKDIRNRTITSKDVKKNTLGGTNVAESKLGKVPKAKTADKSNDLLFATVAPAGPNPVIVRGRGATSVTRIAPGSFQVKWKRDVTGCTWLATYGQPGNTTVDSRFATVRGGDTKNDMKVVLRSDAGAQVDGVGFHVAVLCP